MTGTLPATTVTPALTIEGPLLEHAWHMYERAFTELNSLAVQRHLMYRYEFDEVMADGRILKFLHHTRGDLDGLATYTNQLDSMPLISPAYFQRRWPLLYRQRRIWYVGFVAVDEQAPASVFPDLIAAMHHHSGAGAITVLDVCARMEEVRHLPRSVRVLLARIHGGQVRMERIDAQSYWLYEFPDA